MVVNVVIQAAQSFESEVENPLGDDRAPHTMWTWPDGSWLLVKFMDDGPIVVASRDLRAELRGSSSALYVTVEPAYGRSELTAAAAEPTRP